MIVNVLNEGSCGGVCRFLGGKKSKLGDGREPPDAPHLAHRARHALGSGESISFCPTNLC